MIGWLGKEQSALAGSEMMKQAETNSYEFNAVFASQFHRKSSRRIPNLL